MRRLKRTGPRCSSGSEGSRERAATGWSSMRRSARLRTGKGSPSRRGRRGEIPGSHWGRFARRHRVCTPPSPGASARTPRSAPRATGKPWACFPLGVDSKAKDGRPGRLCRRRGPALGAGGAVRRYRGHPGPEAYQGPRGLLRRAPDPLTSRSPSTGRRAGTATLVPVGCVWGRFAECHLPWPVHRQQAYARAEEKACAEHRGLWRDPRPVPPWEFRRH